MSFQYALECSIKGKNPDIKGAISVIPMNVFPPLICDEGENYNAIHRRAPNAMGNFNFRFVISDNGEKEAAQALTELACNQRTRTSQKFKLTRYTVMKGQAVEDYEVEFNGHYCLISKNDSNRNHIFVLVPSSPRSEILHYQFRLDDPSTSFPSTRSCGRILMTNIEGQSIVQRDD